VGGRLIKFDNNHIITYVSPVLHCLCSLSPGDTATPEALESLAGILVQALEMAAGLREITPLLARLTTPGTAMEPPAKPVNLSFSGGVADCIDTEHPWDAFGDLGPILGRAIRRSPLCGGKYHLGRETIRATVIGAGCHSAQLSGSTVFLRNVDLPMKNLPVIRPGSPGGIHLNEQESPAVIALPGPPAPGYAGIQTLAAQLADAVPTGPMLICLEQDAAKALGQCLALRLPPDRPILCIDRVRLTGESYLDIGSPTGPALPVVVKTLILNS
jgi:ethanolamine utilization protein EutA